MRKEFESLLPPVSGKSAAAAPGPPPPPPPPSSSTAAADVNDPPKDAAPVRGGSVAPGGLVSSQPRVDGPASASSSSTSSALAGRASAGTVSTSAAVVLVASTLVAGADAAASQLLSDPLPPALTPQELEKEDVEADAYAGPPAPRDGSSPVAAALSTGPYAATPRSKRREAVRKEFLHGWRGYEAYAWGKDELHLLSKRGDGGSWRSTGSGLAISERLFPFSAFRPLFFFFFVIIVSGSRGGRVRTCAVLRVAVQALEWA
jgi:hypothetical protein